MGDNLPIDEVELKLDLKPKYLNKKGETLRHHKMQTNVWCSEYLTDFKVPLEEQIELWVEKLEPKKAELKEILSLPDVEGEFFLGFGSTNNQGGAYFTPDLLKRVSDLGLALSFDLYPPSEFET